MRCTPWRATSGAPTWPCPWSGWTPCGRRAPARTPEPSSNKRIDLRIVVPVEDMMDPDSAGPPRPGPGGPASGRPGPDGPAWGGGLPGPGPGELGETGAAPNGTGAAVAGGFRPGRAEP